MSEHSLGCALSEAEIDLLSGVLSAREKARANGRCPKSKVWKYFFAQPVAMLQCCLNRCLTTRSTINQTIACCQCSWLIVIFSRTSTASRSKFCGGKNSIFCPPIAQSAACSEEEVDIVCTTAPTHCKQRAQSEHQSDHYVWWPRRPLLLESTDRQNGHRGSKTVSNDATLSVNDTHDHACYLTSISVSARIRLSKSFKDICE